MDRLHWAPWIPVCLGILLHLTGAVLDSDLSQGPVFITEPPDRVDFSNSTGALIECSVHGHPLPTIHWSLANGSKVDDVKTIRHVLANGSLHFPPFKATLYRQDVHAGRYQCVGTSPLGVIRSRPVHVRAVVQQYYEVQVYDEYVITGNTAVLKCHIPPFVKEYVQVKSWIRNNHVPIQSGVLSGNRFAMSSSGELYVHQVPSGDSVDTYQCRTVNRLTQEVRVSAAGRVVVSDPKSSVPPRINHHQASLSVVRGTTSEIPCAVQGLPIPTHTWYRVRNGEIEPIETDGRIQKINGLLIIQNTQVSDGGIYICKVSNIIGEEKMETTLTVTESLSAYIEPQEVTSDVGQQVKFTCFASGHPITAVQWMKDGHPLNVDGHRLKVRNQFELTIESVERKDRGMYQCFVGNGEDTAQGAAELTLGAIAPSINISLPLDALQPGLPAKLLCIAVGSPAPKVTWFVDGISLTSDKHMDKRIKVTESIDGNGNYVSVVTIASVEVHDGGYYKCVAENQAGVTEDLARINVYGPLSMKTIPSVYAVAGRDLQLMCPYLGYPILSITWKKDDNVLPTDRRQRVLTNGILIIQNLAKSLDEGDYTCIVRNNREQISQQIRTVHVTVPPIIDPISFPNRHGLQVGARIRLQCVVTEGDMPITITWLKDGRPVTKDMGVNIRKDDDFSSVVTFSSISTRHHGNYTCIASNTVASVNRTTEISVDVPPKWTVQPVDVHVAYRQSVMFDCAAEGSPKPSITWKLATGRFPGDYGDLPLAHDRMVFLTNGSLHIHDVSKTDENYFLCEVSNGIGPPLSKVVQLKVKVPAYFELKSQNKTSRIGDTIQMDCRAIGDTPMVISWFKDKMPVDAADDERISRNDYNTHDGIMSELVIAEADRQDGGLYTCSTGNAYGKDNGHVLVIIREPPEAPDNIRISDHDSRQVHLSWYLPGETSSSITRYIIQYKLSSEEWKPRMHNVSVSGGDSSATIGNLLPGTAYSFRILAENDLGYGQPSNGIAITTSEEEPSGAPRNVQAECIGSETLLITWEPPLSQEVNGELIGYYVGYKLVGTSGQYFYKTIEKERDTVVSKAYLSPLQKYSNYSIKIQAFNRAGHGPSSEPIIAATDEDVPSEPPDMIRCQGLGPQRLNVSWNPPPLISHNGVILGYKVLYKAVRENDQDDDEIYDIKVTVDTTVSLHDLERWTNYSFCVSAFTRIGDGRKSMPIYCHTLEDVPGPPADIKALVISSTSILIVWKKPKNPNGIIKRFTIYMRNVDSKRQQTVKFPSTNPIKLNHEVNNLQENLRYEFWVTASTGIGEGESTRVISQNPRSKAPARIAAFAEYVVTSVNKKVLLPCLVVGHPIPERQWRRGSSVIEDNNHFHLLSDGSLELRNVMRNDSGNFSCRVDNEFGSDEITHVMIVKAPPATPVLVVTAATSSTIHVAWQLRDDGGNPIKGHTLHFKREYGEWENIDVDGSKRNFIIANLQCGKNYQVFVTSTNKIGASSPSNVIHTRTDGAAPGIPPQNTVIHPNASAISISLSEWPDSGCPIRNFMVQYKGPTDSNWVMVSNNLQPQHEWAIIPELQPSTLYSVLVTVHNDAGTTDATYKVYTLLISGSSSIIPINAEDKQDPFYTDISIIMPLVASFLATVIIFVSVCIFTKHYKYSTYRHTKSGAPTDLRPQPETQVCPLDGRQQTLERRSSLHPLAVNAPNADVSGVYDDVCPYATFSLMGYAGDDKKNALHLRTFAVQNEDDRIQSTLVPISDLYSKVSKRPKIEESEGVILRPHRFPSAEDMYTLYPAISEHQLGPYTRPVLEENFSNSDWNVHDKRTNDHQGNQFPVPDLLYHGTDSSSPTPNDSSPDDNPSRPPETARFVGWKQPSQHPEQQPRKQVVFAHDW